MGNASLYLGNSLIMGRNWSREFLYLKEKIWKRLEGWNKQLLFKASKMTLIKAVIQSIPTYMTSTFSLPLGMCKALDILVKQF